jgi:hypothetical protein
MWFKIFIATVYPATAVKSTDGLKTIKKKKDSMENCC